MAESELLPGYNQIEYIVLDRQKSSEIAHVHNFYFNKANGATPLTEIPFSSHKQGWGSLHKNESIEGHTFKIAGKLYSEGFGTHAASETVFPIGGKYKVFKATYGLDEESLCSDGAQLLVIGDGKTLYDSGIFTLGQPHSFEIDIAGVENLTIKTLPHQNIDCDHVDIINPALIP